MNFFAALSGMFQLIGGRKAKGAADRESQMIAGQERYITGAKLQDSRIQQRVMRGQTIAGAAGSGVKTGTGSPLEILAEQAKQFARERDVIQSTGEAKARYAIERGRNVGQAALYQSYAGAAGSFGQAFSGGGGGGFSFGGS
ncbi:MAG: hypothetical protein DRP45_10435 [Candidatus Zixiibacteriota bacterium]|nr:MAG: hypothetical protein DRP45_10435 [candidate division Zixibacteria bacterium]